MAHALKQRKVDTLFLLAVLTLMIGGFFIFSSASLGLLARTQSLFKSVTLNQAVFGLIGGSIAMYITSRIPYTFWKKYSLIFYILSIVGMLAVFVPHLGFAHGGAKRWIDFRFVNFQPSEIYKVTFVMYFAAWLSNVKSKVKTIKYGTVPFIILCIVSAGLLLAEPDTATFGVIIVAGLVMYIAAGARWRDLLLIFAAGVLGIVILAFARPYVMDRIRTFMDPASDPTGTGYQIQQSMIAIGSGGITGRGFGQSVQKFNFLPEPIGDSIYAVAAEEFGFIGSVCIILLYVFFAFRGLKIATQAPDSFGGLLATGIVILIITGSMINISSMLGIFPLSGIPLLFISHGGTALFFTLAEAGIVLNISRYMKR